MTDSELATQPEGQIAPATQTESLLQLAIEKGQDVEVLARLLREERDDQRRRAYFEALAKFQRERPRLVKSRDVTDRGGKRLYKFLDLDGILTAISPTLADCGLTPSFDSETSDGRVKVTCKLSHVDGHHETASFTSEIPQSSGAPLTAPQRTGQSITYGRRYSLIQILGLTDAEDDNDAAGAVETISREDAEQIQGMLDVLAVKEPERVDKFLNVFASDGSTVASIPAAKLNAAVAMLRRVVGEPEEPNV